ncbi:putative PAS/PAC sensor protein (plasmid) [Halalkalicoccus jeotgali B3]|uniref:PAS/PAC sensor protein n=1 Tax=Halalkalicoccus jeotgali (strain DSM 18796 / CECT 7217 / JCM 14584 / KCTC 4019 / B3) TaxID=795797 RepID=D8JB63_HALJB|nr:putative PAS/PAC sensor protein [Halalkalicoccus jeotgali B3]
MLFEEPGVPQTTPEVAAHLDLGRRSTYNRLDRLVKHGWLETKKVGASARVWWQPPTTADTTAPDESTAIASLVDDALVDVGIVVFDENFDVAWLNTAIERYFGLTHERVVGTDKRTLVEEHIAPLVDDLDAFMETVLATDDDNAFTERFECHVTPDSGHEERWLNYCSKPIESGAYAGGQVDLYYDITSQKHEQQLRRERELVQQIFDTAPIGIGVLSPTGDIVRANERTDSLLGVTDDDPDEYAAAERTVYDADGNPVPPDEQPYKQVLDTGAPVFDWQCQIEQSNGERRWLSVNAAPLGDAEGDSDRIVVTGKDITQLKEQAYRLERQRDDLESELDAVFERISDGFYGLDSDLRFNYINDHAAELLDLSKPDAIGSYVGTTLDVTDSFKQSLVEAAEKGRSVVHEDYYEPFDAWFETAIYPSESGVSVYFRNVTERKQHECELQQYETIIETIDDGVYVLDAEGRFVLVNDAYCELTSYDRKALLGSSAAMVVDEQTQAAAGRLEDELVAGVCECASLEADVQTADGETIPAEATFAMLPGDGRRRVGVVRDITERKERERELEHQHEQLTALNTLNDVVRDITDGVIDQSTREEIEATVCARLADVASYKFAWIAEIDPHTQSITSRVEAGVDGYLEEIPLSVDSDDPTGRGPAGRAIRTQEIQVVQNALTDSSFEPWREYAKAYGYRSLVVIPIVYGDTLYGVLGVYADRPKTFCGEERNVIAPLGEIIGHAIAAVERKQALMSDEVTQLEFTAPNFLDTIGLDSDVGGTITFDRAVPTGGGAFLEYGSVTEDAIDTLDALVDQLSHFEAVTIVDWEDGMAQFELELSEPPVVAAVAAHGGYLQQARIEDGDFHLRIHLPATIAARRVIDETKDAYPTINLMRRQQVTRNDDTLTRLQRAIIEDLTDRQRATLEVAVYSGFFEWPRKATGEELADSFGIAAPTFSQHLRKAQKEVFESLFSSLPA